MVLDRRCQCARREIQRFGPVDFYMLIRSRRGANTLYGLSQPVGIFMDIFECHCLGADVASTQGVVSIASNIEHRVTLCLNHQTTHGLTKVTDAVVRLNNSVVHTVLTLSDGTVRGLGL
jgi:hypothetical protein